MRNTMLVLLALLSWQCRKDTATLQENADEVFWVRNEGADMPVWVKGNTASRVFIFFVHGGPGDCAYRYTGFQTAALRQQYATVFWSERNAGASAGNINFDRLSLERMVDDLDVTLKILRHRYGEDISIFLHGHSFGGLLGSAFLCRSNNQDQIKGWIEVDGAHNYPLTNLVSRQMLIDSGLVYIDKGRFVPEWQEIVDYCRSHQANTSLEVSYRINGYAQDAENYLDTPHQEFLPDFFTPGAPVSLLTNLYHLYYMPAGEPFLRSLETANWSDSLHAIHIPSLLLWGGLDFVVPPALGEDAMARLGSEWKKLVVLPVSGHHPMNDEPETYSNEIIAFVERFR